MSLKKPKAETAADTAAINNTAAFEDDIAEGAGTGSINKQAAEADAAPAKTTALAAPRNTAVGSVKVASVVSVFKDLERALEVDWDSLPRVAANQGSFYLKEDDVNIGDEITLSLMSYQPTWCCSPNDTDADNKLVKYGDNDTTAQDGTNFAEHLKFLKDEGFDKAKLSHRMTLVGELVSVTGKGGAGEEMVGNLVQIDMSESGRKSFNTHSIQSTFAVSRGRKTAEQAAVLKLTAVVVKEPGRQYTKVVVSGA
jgi:hypothetical protein